MRSGKQTVQRIFPQASETYFASRGSSLETSRTTLAQAIWKKIEAILAEEFFWRAASEATDGKKRVKRALADFLEKGL